MEARRWYRHRYHSPLSLRIVFATIPRLPRLLHPPIAIVTAAIFFFLLRNERRAVIRNLQVVTGRPAWRLWPAAYGVFYSFCDFMVGYCFVPFASDQELVSMLSVPERGAAAIEAGLAGGRGLVVWTAHIANTEFASRLLELHGRRVNVARVVEPGNAAEAELRELMQSERLRVVNLADAAATIELLCALRAGEIVAMQGDRVYRSAGVSVSFFGRPARFPTGPFHLAYVAGVAVVPGFPVRTGWLRYRMVVGAPLELDHSLPRDQAALEALTRAVSFLEAHVRRWPSQWLNFYDFWPDLAAPGEEVQKPSSTSLPKSSAPCADTPQLQ